MWKNELDSCVGVELPTHLEKTVMWLRSGSLPLTSETTKVADLCTYITSMKMYINSFSGLDVLQKH